MWGLEGDPATTKQRGQQESQQRKVMAEMHSNWSVRQRQEEERVGPGEQQLVVWHQGVGWGRGKGNGSRGRGQHRGAWYWAERAGGIMMGFSMVPHIGATVQVVLDGLAECNQKSSRGGRCMEGYCTPTGAGGWARQSGRRVGMQRTSETYGGRVHAQQLGNRVGGESWMQSKGSSLASLRQTVVA